LIEMKKPRVPSVGDGSTDVAGGERAMRSGHLELGLVALIALAVRLVDLDFAPFIDEMHHVMAARSLLETGSPNIYEGIPYVRGAVFTYLVAGFFALFGESLVVGRLPSVLSGALLVSLLFAWLRAEAGRTAAWTGALLLCFAPIALYLSQWVRFYSLHALFFWLGAYGVYHLVTRSFPARRRVGIAAASVIALVLAYSLQITTVGGVAGLVVFATLVAAPRVVGMLRRHRRGVLIAGAVVVGVAGALVALWLLGAVAWLRGRMGQLDVWALEQAGNPRFYHWLFAETYGVLWTLFPLAVLVALTRRWKLALLFACVFGVALAGHSISAWKSERFVFYAMPAFFALWGMAAGEVLPRLWVHLLGTSRAVLRTVSSSLAGAVVAVALVLALAFAFASIPAYRYARQILLYGDGWVRPDGHLGERYRGHPDWAAAAVRLAPLTDSVQVVIGQPDMKVIYYLGDVDYVLYASYLVASVTDAGALDMKPEFTVWRKVGRPLVSEPESIEAIMRCHATGLIVAEEHVWGWRGGVPRPTADFIEQNAGSLDLPEELKILAFRWETAEPERSDRCDRVQQARREAPIRPLVGAGP
jgi:4-amino-4-deoxy-L-arabinose transferase-like glycosyltransferase